MVAVDGGIGGITEDGKLEMTFEAVLLVVAGIVVVVIIGAIVVFFSFPDWIDRGGGA